MSRYRKVAVTIELNPMLVVLLDAIGTHVGTDRSGTIADALALYFAAIPRLDDSDFEASKPGGAT